MSSNSSNSSLVTKNRKRLYYTPKYWQYDPIYHTNIKLFIKDILNLKKIQFTEGSNNIIGFFYGNHPVREIDIIATITAFDIRDKIIKYILDDGSATIACVNFTDKLIREPEFERGTVIRVLGRIKDYKGKREIINTFGKIWVIKDPNMEFLRWAEILTLKKDVYSKPFVLSNKMKSINNVSDIEVSNKMRSINNVSDIEVSNKVRSINNVSDIELSNKVRSINNVSDIELSNKVRSINNVSDIELSNKNTSPTISDELESDSKTSMSSFHIFERMKNLDNSFTQATEDAFTNLITHYIYKYNLTKFSIVRIRQSHQLGEFAKKVAVNQYTCPKPSAPQVTALFTKALRVLVLEGFLNYADYNKVTYRVDSLFVDMVKEWKVV